MIEGWWLEGRSPKINEGLAKDEMYVFGANREIMGWVHMRPRAIVGLFILYQLSALFVPYLNPLRSRIQHPENSIPPA
jgi:hypothetical protein